MSAKPRLQPLPVGWMVSPSVPMLRVWAGEDSVAFPTTVEFVATYHSGDEARVRLVFRGGYWLRHTPSHADTEVVRTDQYDWSNTFQLSGGNDFAASLERFRQMWKESGVCPDPRIYIVESSPWLEELAKAGDMTGYRHVLVLGHDSYAEVIAERWDEERVS